MGYKVTPDDLNRSKGDYNHVASTLDDANHIDPVDAGASSNTIAAALEQLTQAIAAAAQTAQNAAANIDANKNAYANVEANEDGRMRVHMKDLDDAKNNAPL